jgi:NAD(P)H-nitrite reductase large subunit
MKLADTRPIAPAQFERERIERVRAWVTGIDTAARELTLHDGATLSYDELLVATGSRPNDFGWPGHELAGVQGFYDLMDLSLLYENAARTRHAVIVGGGLIGIELAEMLHSRGIEITFLVREASYWNNILPAEESAMINRLIRESGMELRLETELEEIVDDGSGRVGAVVTSAGDRIDCQLVGLTAGVTPNLSALEGSGIETGRGVLVDWSFKTSAPHVYAAGDCAELRTPEGERNLLEQVWYTGRAQGEAVADVIAGDERTYQPGIWFNSAKFLDLEYQVYGDVGRRLPGEESLYWEHPGGRHAVRLVHEDGVVIGINLMGIRFRHEVCEAWIRDRRPVDWVLDHLGDANFDPELFVTYESQAVAAFRRALP